MQGYFSKVTGSALNLAKKGAALIGNVVTATTASTTSSTEPSSKPDLDFEILFRKICLYLDHEAEEPDGNSAEADARLQSSGLRSALKKLIAMLLVDDQNWLTAQRAFSKEVDEVRIPVIDYLLQKNVIKQLCDRAINDLPRGSMPLLLTALSTLIRTVNYPLLPHQSVYKPIGHLISVASRYEAVFASHQRKTPAERERLAAYKRRIVIGLTALLRTVWRKITEHPPMVDLFIISQRRAGVIPDKPAWSLTPQSSARVHFDLLAALPPLLAEPRVASAILETLLVALSIRDSRIPSFLSDEANVWGKLVETLCEDLTESMTWCTQNASQVLCPAYLSVLVSSAAPPSMLASRAFPVIESPANLSAGQPPVDTPSVEIVHKLLKGLNVLRALQYTIRSRWGQLHAQSSRRDTDVATMEEEQALYACLVHLCTEFVRKFLLTSLRPALDTTNERTSTAAYILLRLILQTLAVPNVEADGHDVAREVLSCGEDEAQKEHRGDRDEAIPSLFGLTLCMLIHGPSKVEGLPSKWMKSIRMASSSVAKLQEELTEMGEGPDDPMTVLVQTSGGAGDGGSSIEGAMAAHSPPRGMAASAQGTPFSTPATTTSATGLGPDFVLVLLDRVGSRSKEQAQASGMLLAALLASSPPLVSMAHVHSLPFALALPPSAPSSFASSAALSSASNFLAAASCMKSASSGRSTDRSSSALLSSASNTASGAHSSQLWVADPSVQLLSSLAGLACPSALQPPLYAHAYVEPASRRLVYLIFHGTAPLASLPTTFFDRFLAGVHSSHASGASFTGKEDSFVDRLMKRLAVFAQLTLPDQILLSELFQHTMLSIALLILLGSESTAQRASKLAHGVVSSMETMLTNVAQAARRQGADFSRKWQAARDYLWQEAVDYLVSSSGGRFGTGWLEPDRSSTIDGSAEKREGEGREGALPSQSASAMMFPPPAVHDRTQEEDTAAASAAAVTSSGSATKTAKRSSFFSPMTKYLGGNVFEEAGRTGSPTASVPSQDKPTVAPGSFSSPSANSSASSTNGSADVPSSAHSSSTTQPAAIRSTARGSLTAAFSLSGKSSQPRATSSAQPTLPSSTPSAPSASTAAASAAKTNATRRQLEAEAGQVKAMLATVLVLYEMICEMHGIALAAVSLRRRLFDERGGAAEEREENAPADETTGATDHSPATSSEGTAFPGSWDGNKEEWEEERAEEHAVESLLGLVQYRPSPYGESVGGVGRGMVSLLGSLEHKESEFLQEYAGLEAMLDGLTAMG